MAANRGEEITSSIPVAQPPSTGSRTPPRAAVPHWRKWFWRAILACLLAAVLCYAGLRYHWRHEFRVGIEAIRAAGYPVNLEELDKWYTGPESGENAASWILEAIGCYRAPSEEADGWSLWFLVRNPPAAPRTCFLVHQVLSGVLREMQEEPAELAWLAVARAALAVER